jgi:hypothetical protein
MNKFEEAFITSKAQYQSRCPHQADSGCTHIIWHTLRTKETVGVCTLCNRIWHDNDFDYWLWRKKPSLSQGSSDNGLAPCVGHGILPITGSDPGPAFSPTEFDKLSDTEIAFLMDGIRKYRKMLKAVTQAIDEQFSGPEWRVG